MKKTIYFILITLFFSACQLKEDKVESLTTNLNFKHLTNSIVAFEKKGSIVLSVPDEKIMQTFKSYNLISDLDLEPESFELVKIDEKDYLRFYSKKDYVSTIALIKDANNFYRTGTTVCTSKACATGGGCVPNGLYCTNCQPPGTNPPIKGDCKRTTSDGPVIEE